jgi:hypothetical protein
MVIPWLEELEQREVLLLQPYWEQQGVDPDTAASKARAQVTLQRPQKMKQLLGNSLPGQGLSLSPAMVSLLLRGLDLDPKRRATLVELQQLGTLALQQVRAKGAEQQAAIRQEVVAELGRKMEAQGRQAAKEAQAAVRVAVAKMRIESQHELEALRQEQGAAAAAAQDQLRDQCRGRLMVARAEAAAAVAAAVAELEATAEQKLAAARADAAAAQAAMQADCERRLAAAREEAAAAVAAAKACAAAEARRLTAVRADGEGRTLPATTATAAAVDPSNLRGLRELVTTMGEREDGASYGDWRARAATMVPNQFACKVVAAAGAARGEGAVGWAIPVALESHGSQQQCVGSVGCLSWSTLGAAIGRVACEVGKRFQGTTWG